MIKKILPAALAVSVLALVSCTQTVKVENPEVSGLLSGAFRVVEDSYEVSKDEDGNKVITVKVERTDETLPFTSQTVDVYGAHSGALTLAGFGYEAYNEDGQMIDDEEADDNDYAVEQQLALLRLNPGETGELTLKLDDDDIPASVVLTSDVTFLRTDKIQLNGSINQYVVKNFDIQVDFKDKELKGRYQYLTSPEGVYLYLHGKIKATDAQPGRFIYFMDVIEDNGAGTVTGQFAGEFYIVRDNPDSPYYYMLKGDFENFQGRHFYYNMKSDPIR